MIAYKNHHHHLGRHPGGKVKGPQRMSMGTKTCRTGGLYHSSRSQRAANRR
jgi:hypothetical protein